MPWVCENISENHNLNSCTHFWLDVFSQFFLFTYQISLSSYIKFKLLRKKMTLNILCEETPNTLLLDIDVISCCVSFPKVCYFQFVFLCIRIDTPHGILDKFPFIYMLLSLNLQKESYFLNNKVFFKFSDSIICWKTFYFTKECHIMLLWNITYTK